MSKKGFYLAALKFEKHKIHFNYDKITNTVLIGTVKSKASQYVWGGLLVLFGLALIIMAFYSTVQIIAIRSGVVGLVPLVLGFILIYHQIKKTRSNQGIKHITPYSVRIINDGTERIILKENIVKFDYEIESKKDGIHTEGRIYAITNEGKLILITSFTLNNKTNVHYLKEDLEYLVKLFNDFME